MMRDPCVRLFGQDQESAPVVDDEMTSADAQFRAMQAHVIGDVEKVRQWTAIFQELLHQEAEGLRPPPRPTDPNEDPFEEG